MAAAVILLLGNGACALGLGLAEGGAGGVDAWDTLPLLARRDAPAPARRAALLLAATLLLLLLVAGGRMQALAPALRGPAFAVPFAVGAALAAAALIVLVRARRDAA